MLPLVVPGHTPSGPFLETSAAERVRFLATRIPDHVIGYRVLEPEDVRMATYLRGSETVQYFRLVAPPGVRTMTMVLNVRSVGDPIVRIPVRSGATAKDGDTSFAVGLIGPVALPKTFLSRMRTDHWTMDAFDTSHRLWTVGLTQTGAAAAFAKTPYVFEPLDRNGKTIAYVDVQGKPLDAKAAAARAREGSILHPDERPASVVAVPERPTEDGYVLATNVNPGAIGTIALRPEVETRQTIGPFSVEPALP